jgi:hypothetical protein
LTTGAAATFRRVQTHGTTSGGIRVTDKTPKPSKRAAAKPASTRRPASARRRRKPSHDEISTRAYFIHLEEGLTDEVGNWLRAERELTSAA